MNEVIFPFLLTIIAGFSTMIGTIFIFTKMNINKLTKYFLAFAAGVMISVSLLDLIPESLNFIIKNNIKSKSFIILITGIIIGIIISVVIDKIIPQNINVNNKKGIFSMIAIIIHNIPEGIITFLTSSTNISIGIMLTIAIALHNLPEGISISVPIYTATNSKKRAVGYTFISALAEPLGAIIALIFLKPIITNTVMGFMISITAGIMLHIGIFQLVPISIQYKNKIKILFSFILGILLMIISNIFMSFL